MGGSFWEIRLGGGKEPRNGTYLKEEKGGGRTTGSTRDGGGENVTKGRWRRKDEGKSEGNGKRKVKENPKAMKKREGNMEGKEKR